MSPESFAYLSLAIGLAATANYIVSILRGQTKPHLYTWIIWSILPTIGFFAQRHSEAGAASWTTGLMACGSIVITLLAIKYGERHRTKSDLLALAVSMTAILPWLITKDPLGSVILISLIDIVAFYPTFRKSWHKPREENLTTYCISSLTMGLSFFAMANYNLTTVLYPAVFVGANIAFVFFCLWRRSLGSSHVSQDGL